MSRLHDVRCVYYTLWQSRVNPLCRFYATFAVESDLIRFRLKELIAEKEFRDERVITLAEIARETGIHRATLSKIAHEKGYNTGTENVDRLCRYFGCSVADVLEYIES